MLQVAYWEDERLALRVFLPPVDELVLPGLPWHDVAGIFTPSFWALHCHWFEAYAAREQSDRDPAGCRLGCAPPDFRLGATVREEMAACLLGGHGMPAEIGLAAFYRVRDEELLRPGITAAELEAALARPFLLPRRDHPVHYRYPRQKASYLAAALARMDADPASFALTDGRALRDSLLCLPGVGPKTASWIARNWLGTDDVAIIDVHILRALRLLNLVDAVRLPRDYAAVEGVFVRLARALQVRAATLDAVMWQQMRRWGHLAPTPLSSAS